jgi:hypothetical protein
MNKVGGSENLYIYTNGVIHDFSSEGYAGMNGGELREGGGPFRFDGLFSSQAFLTELFSKK